MGSNPAEDVDVCVVCLNKDQKAKCGKIKTKKQLRINYEQIYKRIKKHPAGVIDVCGVCVCVCVCVCVVQYRQKAKCGTVNKQKQVRMKYKA
jgi:hypothetical protein